MLLYLYNTKLLSVMPGQGSVLAHASEIKEGCPSGPSNFIIALQALMPGVLSLHANCVCIQARDHTKGNPPVRTPAT